MRKHNAAADMSILSFEEARDLVTQLRHMGEPGWMWEYGDE